jgi:hypothetical protein
MCNANKHRAPFMPNPGLRSPETQLGNSFRLLMIVLIAAQMLNNATILELFGLR